MTKPSDLAIVLVSGGMDSLVTAAIAKTQYENLAFLHLNYGQKTEQKEHSSFHKIADFYHVPSKLRKIINVEYFKQIGGSSLTDDKIEVKDYKGENRDIPDSYVPFRNTHIVAMAVSWAEVINAKKIFIGAVYEDSSGYPDCRPNYIEALNKLIQVGTKNGDIEVLTPVIHMKKYEIVKKAIELKAPLESSWSCYKNEDKACGKCDSCILRLKGFKEAGLQDPIEYESLP